MKQRNFKIVSLLTVFTIVLNVLSAVVLLSPAKAASTANDTLSRLAASTVATHTFNLTSTTGTAVEITIPASFTGTAATATATCTATGNVITCTTVPAAVVVTGLTNPVVGSYNVTVDFTGDTDVLVNVPIVDSDQVNVSGYINTSLTFDLDTGTTFGGVAPYTNQMMTDCAYNACLREAGGAAAANYTVDLGQLVAGNANVSGDSVLHADAVTGAINYVGYDLSSNAAGGVNVVVTSANNGWLQRGAVQDAWDIGPAAVADNTDWATLETALDNGYGISFNIAPQYENLGSGGTVVPEGPCDTGYCSLDIARTVVAVNTSVQALRGTVRIGALANGTNPAGTYTDVLTFIATATY